MLRLLRLVRFYARDDPDEECIPAIQNQRRLYADILHSLHQIYNPWKAHTNANTRPLVLLPEGIFR